MTAITDEFMREMLAKTKAYCLVILKSGPAAESAARPQIVWEHGRRNFQLRAAGTLPIVCPVTDASEIKGIGIFNAEVEEVRRIMDGDPGVQAGIFVYEVHPCRSFPGDTLPG